MAKQLNVNLAFSADTGQARAQIQALQNQLNQLMSKSVSNNIGKTLTKDVYEAQSAVAQLKVSLDSAFNVNTGKLDLSKFSESMNKSNMSLEKYKDQLSKLGSEGQKAFLGLAQSVMSAEVPIRRTNQWLTDMGTTLKNTARWQLSSSMLHGFMGSVQKAYGYAQDLNASLNDIRIVTGQTTDQMARFAEQANKAARTLSTTTTEYTKASLIYYQQGLEGDEVLKRADITTKMANAAGESAEKVSDQLTAVWNNFYDGSQSLEHYADVMVALGAATASSTDEIAGGLEKFAAIADTIGLSYEYAASALATITSNTRQSEEVVGTALKTIFARIQGLNLGETLDDGTTLNKYSEALQKVGLSIFDQNNEIKNMDTILDEMADKWDKLSKDQQMALAQTVAGTRQYTQLVALMDNWNAGDSDSMIANLETAKNATGALQEQADIQAESWDAASDRVRAAAEAIYSDLINDEFFIDLLNGFEKFLSLIDKTIDSAGGLKGILAGLSAILLKTFSSQAAQSLENMAYNLKMLTEKGRQSVQQEKDKAFKLASEIQYNDVTEEGAISAEAMKQQVDLQYTLINNADKLSDTELKRFQSILDINKAYAEQAILAAKAVDSAQDEYGKELGKTRNKIRRGNKSEEDLNKFTGATEKLNNISQASVNAQTKIEELFSGLKNRKGSGLNKDLEEIKKDLDGVGASNGVASIEKLQSLLSGGNRTIDFDKKLEAMAKDGELLEVAMLDGAKTLEDYGGSVKLSQKETDQAAKSAIKFASSQKTLENTTQSLAAHTKETKDAIINYKVVLSTTAQTFVDVAQRTSGVVMAISSLSSAWDTLQDPDLSGWEKFTSVALSAGMAIPMLINSLSNIPALITASNAGWLILTASIQRNTGSIQANTLANLLNMELDTAQIVLDAALEKGKGKLTLANLAEAMSEKGIAVGKALNLAVSLESLITTKALTVATWAQNLATKSAIGGVLAHAAAWIALQVAAWPLIAIFAAIATAIALIVGTIKGIQALAKIYNQDANAAKEAEEATKNLAEAYNKTKQEYQDMIKAMESYQSARDGLDSLTKGTEEYRDALREANQQAIDLIDKYGLMEDKDYSWQDGEIVIKDSSMDKIQAEKEEEVITAYSASQMGNAEAKESRSKSNQTNLKRDIRDEAGFGNGDITANIIGNLAVSAMATMINPILGAAMLAAGGVTNTILTSEAEKFDKTIDKAVELGQKDSSLFTSKEHMAKTLDVNINDTDLVNALWENRDAIQNLSADMNLAAEAEKLAAQNSANEIMADSGYEYSKSGRMALEAGGEIYQQLYKEEYDKIATDKKTSKDDFEDYAKAAGLDDLKGFKMGKRRSDGSVEYSYIDEEGKKQEAVALQSEIAATLAAASAANNLEAALNTLKQKIEQLNNSGKTGDAGFASFLSQHNLEGTTQSQFTDLNNAINEMGGVDSYLGLTGTLEENNALAQSYGFADAEAYKTAFNDALNVEWSTPIGFIKLSESITLGASNQMENTFKEMGSVGGQAYVDTINSIASGVNWDALTSDQKISMLNQLASIDWTSWKAGDQAIEIANNYGIAIDKTTESWQKNIQAMRDASNALPDFQALKNELEKIKEISSNINLGSIITKDDYNTLVNYNQALSAYFTILSDGTAQFTGDILDFQQSIKESGQQALQDGIAVYNDRISEMKAQYSSGTGLVGGNPEDVGNLFKTADSVGSYSNSQLAFLESQNFDAEQIKSWKEELKNEDDVTGTLESIAEAVNKVGEEFIALPSKINEAQGQIQTAMNELALSAEDADERLKLFEDGLIDEEAYAAAAQAAHNLEKWEGLDSKEVEDYADSLMEAAKSSSELSEDLIGNEEAAEDVATYVKKMNQGIDKLADGFKDWSDVLKKSSKTSEEYSKAMAEMKNAMSDVLGVSEDFIRNDFILKNLKDIEKAATGDAKAIDRLKIALSEDILCQILVIDNFDQANQKIKDLQSEILNLDKEIKIGAVLDTEQFATAAQGLIDAAGMTVEQAQAYFNSLGYEPTFVMQNETRTAPMYGKRVYTDDPVIGYVEVGDDGSKYPYIKAMTTHEEQVYMGEHEQNFVVPALSPKGTPQIKSLTKVSSGKMNNYSSSNSGGKKPGKGGGGGGSKPAKPEKVDKTKKSEVVERYKEINDQIDDMADKLEDATTEADRLYGRNRINKMKEVSNTLQQEIKLLEQKTAEAKEYLKIDKKALQKGAKEVGVNFSFDADGNISNYESQMEALYNRLAAAEKKADPSNFKTKEAQDEFIEKHVTPLKEQIDSLEELINQYDETRELIEDLDNEARDKFNEWQDNNFEILNYELELKLEIDDSELRKLEYLLSKIEDDFYSMAEAAALMIGNVNDNGGLDMANSQLEVHKNKLKEVQEQKEALDKSYRKGEISQDAYIEGLKELEDLTYDNVEAIQEIDKTMLHYYGDTLEAAADELSKYTDLMEQHIEVLEHYANIMDIIGKSTDYEAMGVILEGQAEVAENMVEVSKANYEMLEAQRQARRADYEAAIGNATDEELEILKQKWLDAEAAANDAQDRMMEDIETWAESLKAVLENKLAGFAQALENVLTGDFGSFDEMTAAMDRANSLQEEYLTTTNKIYETNKLINKAQQDIDKTTNTAAKKRLQAYIDETEQLQNQAELSNYELEIQQAKYDLVLAEIALEEAQNAKSTVRLQRDAEGNFGYVYTADSSKIAEAEQQLEDAQNRLYNIGLRGANEYTEKYQQTLQEMYDTLTELQNQYLEGAFESEAEYNEAVRAAKEFYFEKLKQYSNLYQIALTTDSAVVADAWSTDFSDMMDKTYDWSVAIDDYLYDVKEAFRLWEEQVEIIRSQTVGPDLDALKTKVGDITKEHDLMTEGVVKKGGVIDALKAEIEQVDGLTGAYANVRDQIIRLQKEHEDLIDQLRKDIKNPTLNETVEPTPQKPKEDNKSSGGSSEGNSAPKSNVPTLEKGSRVSVKPGTRWYYDSYGTAPSGTARGGTISYINLSGSHPYNIEGLGWIKKTDIVGFDTGGYTGEWAGQYGKFALLHQKELILNPDDTSNLLSAMDVLEKILQTLDLVSLNSQLGGLLHSPSFGTFNQETLQQNVTIEASFPGVSFASEIEDAFGNLVNLASQYANRK